ncbi:protein indeterminate-domain 12-like [Phoenix dactylifera]|uniref:Protein EARLY HEADING DATE 2 n=1 Tax=Phoenix dactylifera TaxID=42345 RepID=A0A8B7D5B1_PHODC|nr:protein indeterminate-domain 12-like [Phoenix dactylifera]
MFPSGTMSNCTSMSEEASVSSDTRAHDYNNSLSSLCAPISPPYRQQQQQEPQPKAKKKRSQPGNPDPDAEVIALSPKTLMATNRFVCEICNKGFQRDQNLQLHRRGHNLPWKLRQKSSKEGVRKRVYVCPEASCIHHHPSRALGDLTGIKKHYSRKHGEKKWKCEKCSKRYAVHSDWKAHAKTCGTREYRCDCGALFSRKDSFITHRAFCDALAEESARLMATNTDATKMTTSISPPLLNPPLFLPFSSWDSLPNPNPNFNTSTPYQLKPENTLASLPHPYYLHHLPTATSPYLSATSLLQKASTMGPTTTTTTTGSATISTAAGGQMGSSMFDAGHPSAWQRSDGPTRDFLGVVASETGEEELLSLTGALGLDLVTAASCDRGDHAKHLAGFPPVPGTWGDRRAHSYAPRFGEEYPG